MDHLLHIKQQSPNTFTYHQTVSQPYFQRSDKNLLTSSGDKAITNLSYYSSIHQKADEAVVKHTSEDIAYYM